MHVVPITDVFDLHSFAPRECRAALEAYLEAAHEAGFTALRLIHGRGIGMQREVVRTVLARTTFVYSFSDAPAEAGGWGATVVELCYSAETGSLMPPGSATNCPSGE